MREWKLQTIAYCQENSNVTRTLKWLMLDNNDIYSVFCSLFEHQAYPNLPLDYSRPKRINRPKRILIPLTCGDRVYSV